MVGMGRSGRALLQLFDQKNIVYSCYDDIQKTGYESFEKAKARIHALKEKLTIAVSPGIKPSHPLMQEALLQGCPIVTEIDIAFQFLEKKLPPFIGVTGTNGKTTVVEFLSFALSSIGIRSEAVGNIGLPLVERLFLQKEPLPEVFVIELSSFQLEYTKLCPLRGAAYLNFAPDHLDWHGTLEEYHKAKSSIFSHVDPSGVCLLHTSVPSLDIPHMTFSTTTATDIGTDGEIVFYKGTSLGTLPAPLRGKLLHDTENFLASCGLLVPLYLSYEQVKTSWEAFQKGPHRIQLIDTINTVSFWDDSKATNISSTEAAVLFLEGPIVLIAGGVHKGFSYLSWKDVFKGRVKAIVAIGQAKPALVQDLTPDYPVIEASTFSEAFEKAVSLAPPNSHVLLSPGCSSFDMFANYKERGDTFQKLVKSLQRQWIS